MKKLLVTILIMFTLLMTKRVEAGDQQALPALTQIGAFGGRVTSSVFHGPIVCLARGQNLEFLDLSTPARVKVVTRMRMADEIEGLSLSGDILAVSVRADGVHLLDLADPLHPQDRLFIRGRDFRASTRWSGDRLWVCNYYKGGRGTLDCYKLDLQAWKAELIFEDNSSRIEDVPSLQSTSSSLAAKPDLVRNGALFRTQTDDVSRLYSVADDGLVSTDTRRSGNFLSREVYPFIAQWVYGVALTNMSGGPIACVSSNESGWFEVLDVRDPSRIELLGRLKLKVGLGKILIYENMAYVASEKDGVFIINLRNPRSPELLASFKTPEPVKKMAIRKNILVAQCEKNLEFFDFSNPKSPARIGHYETRYAVRDFSLRGDLAYVACHDFDIVNIADPAHPRLVGRLPYYYSGPNGNDDALIQNGCLAECALIIGDVAYTPVAIDISTVTKPRLLGSDKDLDDMAYGRVKFVTTWGQNAVRLFHSHTSGREYYRIIASDISSSGCPVDIASFSSLLHTADLAVMDGILYVADGEGGLVMLKIPERTVDGHSTKK